MPTACQGRQLLVMVLLLASPGLSQQGCPKVNDTLLREKRIEAFTVQVLSKLGYTGGKPPNPTKTVEYGDIDPEILKLYHQSEAMLYRQNSHCPLPGDPSNFGAQRVLSLNGNTQQDNGHLKTDFFILTKDSSVTGMELNMALTKDKRSRRQTASIRPHATVDIYLLELDSSNNTVRKDLLYREVYQRDHLTRLQVDITSFMNLHWDELVTAAYAMIEVDIDSDDELTVDPNDPPSLLVFTSLEDPTQGRHRRQAARVADKEYCMANPTESRCCVRPLQINFHTDLNWRWILWPRNVHINYCAGLCPYSWPTTTERYPDVLVQYRYLNPTAAAEPCCSAQKLQGINAIVQEVPGQRPSIMMLSEVRVESCVCS